MKKYREHKPYYNEWIKWFAWYPVKICDNAGCWTVWLEPVEYKRTNHYAGDEIQYRLIK